MKRITYQIQVGQETEVVLVSKAILCTDDTLETNLAAAKAEAYNGEVTVEDVPDNRPLEAIKAERIQQSKANLTAYLESHPIQWTDGNYYAITSEKQQWLTSKLFAATAAKAAGQPYNLTWNDTQEVCTAWELDTLWQLAYAIDARVTALVTYQQTQEKALREAESLEALAAIEVDYDAVG